MYGLLIESIMDYIRKRFGDEAWESIRQKAGIPHTCFSTHETYSEQLIPKIADSASQVIGLPEDELMDAFGVAFVSFVGQYGYDSILKVPTSINSTRSGSSSRRGNIICSGSGTRRGSVPFLAIL